MDKIQTRFVNEVVRPIIEKLTMGQSMAATFSKDYAALQSGENAIPATSDILDDGRDDAPILTGAYIQELAAICAAIEAATTGAQKVELIQKSVRPLDVIYKG